MRAILLLAFCQVVFGQTSRFGVRSRYEFSGQIANEIRNLTKTWVAGDNPLPLSHYRTGALQYNRHEQRLSAGVLLTTVNIQLPEIFDARDKWPQCNVIGTIRNQGCCGSCFAVSATSAMTDRWCIHSPEHETFEFGSIDVLSCCRTCGDGCEGGYLGPTWQYWVNQGISSGAAYGSSKGCHPYPFAECKTIDEEDVAPKCSRRCNTAYNVTNVADDRRFGRIAYSIQPDEQKIMEEIFIGGPVQASFDVYLDFKAYKKGVYRHVWGPPDGGHAIKIIGWGVENVDGRPVKYWLCANSWGNDWGLKGYFKFLRGENHLNIEADVHAGLPHYTKHDTLRGIEW